MAEQTERQKKIKSLQRRVRIGELQQSISQQEGGDNQRQQLLTGDEPQGLGVGEDLLDVPNAGQILLTGLLDVGDQIANAPVVKQGLAVLDRINQTLSSVAKLPGGLLPGDQGTVNPISALLTGERTPSAQEKFIEETTPQTESATLNFLTNVVPSAVGFALDNPLAFLGVKALRSKPKLPKFKNLKISEQLKITGSLQAKNAKAIETANKLTAELETLTGALSDKSVRTARTFQKRIPEITRELNATYGARLDDIIANVDEPVTFGQYEKFLTEINQTISSIELPRNKAQIELLRKSRQFIRKKLKKAEVVDEKTGDIRVDKNKLKEIRDEAVDVKTEILNFKREFRDRAGSRTPTVRKVLAEFDDGLGGFLEEAGVEGLRDLNATYKPIRQTLNRAEAVFKPRARGGEAEVTAGKKLVERVARGKADLAERELIDLLEKGDPKGFVKGLGEITAPAKDIGNRLNIIKKSNPLAGEQAADQIAGRVQVMTDNLRKLEKMSNTDRVIANAQEFERIMTEISIIKRNRKILLQSLSLAGASTALGTTLLLGN